MLGDVTNSPRRLRSGIAFRLAVVTLARCLAHGGRLAGSVAMIGGLVTHSPDSPTVADGNLSANGAGAERLCTELSGEILSAETDRNGADTDIRNFYTREHWNRIKSWSSEIAPGYQHANPSAASVPRCTGPTRELRSGGGRMFNQSTCALHANPRART